MTGGNALAAFIRMIQQWVIQLGVNVTQVIETFKYVFYIFFSELPIQNVHLGSGILGSWEFV